MSDIGEGLGTAVEGGLFARAIGGKGSARTGDGPDIENGHFAEGACLNCGAELIGPHCHSCGQKVHLHRTIGAFAHDLLHGALHFDGKTWRTLPKLAFKPGELTRRYIDGERVRFVSPMALFLFSIFLMFAVFQVLGISTPSDFESPALVEGNLDKAVDDLEKERRATAALLEQTDPDDEDYVDRAQRLKELDRRIENFGEARTVILGDEDGARMTMEGTGIDWIDEGLVEKWRKNPGLMLYKLQTNFYKFSWLLIPLSIPFVWLLFAWKREFKAYDHAIFVTYSLCFMTLLILAVTLAGVAGVGSGLLIFAMLLIPPIHIYKQLRGTYRLSRLSAVWRLAVLTIFIVIVVTLFLQLLLVLGAF